MLIEILSDYWKPAPNVFMGVFAIFAGFIASLLPETVGLPLPESTEEALTISKRADRGFFTCTFPKNCKDMWFGDTDDDKVAKTNIKKEEAS